MQQQRQFDCADSELDIRELLRPEAYGHPVEAIELRETHISWVLRTGTFAYKIKKPVKLDFIDTSTLQRRRFLCLEELRLNRRLAPELYVDVVPITRSQGHLLVGGNGPIVDYAVRMHQFAAADELPALLEDEEVNLEEIAALGTTLAQFHLQAPVAPPNRAPEKTQQMYDSVLGNLAQLLTHLDSPQPAAQLGRLVDWTHDRADTLEPIFQLREQSGFVRECHGDLHAANIVRLKGRLVPFDCIEFDPGLRWIDVMSDVAFLVMDLASHGRTDLSFALLNRYLEVTGDYDGLRVLPFYAVYRALVRAKVDALMVERVPTRAAEFRDRLQRRLKAAQTWTAPERPMLILMHGASGSGKSWLSGHLAPTLRAVRVRSDLERKRIAGLEPTTTASARVREGIYSPAFSHRTYSRLADCAESCLRSGLSVIVDAAFLESADRRQFLSLAARLQVLCVIVSCEADPIRLAQRVDDRAKEHKDASDATLSVLDAQLREIQPFEAAEEPCVIHVDTEEPGVVPRVIDQISARVLAG
ncbi:MAG TPA: AAA family ATPase [Steroidobacteraceae bacterium]|nr:AAA family ATPase [Steroidobacteraceae bacterium]